MSRASSAWRGGILAALLCLAGTAAGAETELSPGQMIRSLQTIQDRLADGDHAVLPMQRKALEMIDARLRASTAEDFADRGNFNALLVYGMSGGNPATIAATLARLELDDADKRIGSGVVEYLRGNSGRALSTLAEVDPLLLTPDVGAFVALVKGSVNAAERPADGYANFDTARLLAPGTLIEEAALRRTIALATQQGNAERFIRAAEQYTRRFIRSPYASQFADSFLAGVLQLRDKIDLKTTADVIAQMRPAQSQVIYLRIARSAALEDYRNLVDFAQQGLAAFDEEAQPDPRTVLYESLAAITSDKVGDVKERLSDVDRSRLSANDRRLLDAALSIAGEVTRPPAPRLAESEEVPAPLPASAPVASGEIASAADETPQNTMLTDARKRLEAIDQLLREKRN